MQDRINLYNAGVDDCMEYPVDIQELQVRVKAAVRRRNHITNHTLTHRDIVFNLVSREIFSSGSAVDLIFKEKCLLEVFFLNKGRILSKQYLHDKLFSWNKDINSNVIEVYISSLRKKLGRDCIITFSGQGYRLG
ncbi:response regulator transcription factor [Salmonella enterica]|nr:DNA-binding response regulator [Salmonella enterica]EBD7338777.1 response regulator transcription factor [Salmonella enterica]ECP2052806.1 response regulator transcription factor [Salmonella enterica]ECX5291057.1 response regulator transcription factor [Salmonella enterica]EDX0904655.1 response regulator transcription factor [Salmonella enterica subsp. enterica]